MLPGTRFAFHQIPGLVRQLAADDREQPVAKGAAPRVVVQRLTAPATALRTSGTGPRRRPPAGLACARARRPAACTDPQIRSTPPRPVDRAAEGADSHGWGDIGHRSPRQRLPPYSSGDLGESINNQAWRVRPR